MIAVKVAIEANVSKKKSPEISRVGFRVHRVLLTLVYDYRA